MKTRILITLFLFFFHFIPEGKDCHASVLNEDHLWIEFGKSFREKDGSLTLPLRLNYGRFPEKRIYPGDLDDIRAFYTLNEKNGKGETLFYNLDIEKDCEGFAVNIRSFKGDHFIVYANAAKVQSRAIRQYSAKTSFVIFGQAFSEDRRVRSVDPDRIERQLEICVLPEYQVWPQTGNPVGIEPLFEGEPMPRKAISIFDENMPPIEIITDEKGEHIYVPPDDRKLNRKGGTDFKQSVIALEKVDEDTKYISSYTLLLHRSRFQNYRLLMGALIFAATMISSFLFVIVKRRRFKF